MEYHLTCSQQAGSTDPQRVPLFPSPCAAATRGQGWLQSLQFIRPGHTLNPFQHLRPLGDLRSYISFIVMSPAPSKCLPHTRHMTHNRELGIYEQGAVCTGLGHQRRVKESVQVFPKEESSLQEPRGQLQRGPRQDLGLSAGPAHPTPAPASRTMSKSRFLGGST